MGYTITFTTDEHKALAWIADRYSSATILYDGMSLVGGEDPFTGWGGTFDIPEYVMWEYAEALPEENGVVGAILPSCVGGTLADKLIALLDSIV